jgi:3-methyladenine DNA glycosylase AlkD
MKPASLTDIQKALLYYSNQKDARILQGFFKTGPGQYAEGDQFRGIRTPLLHKLVPLFTNIALNDIIDLLQSHYHEDRLLALFILVKWYKNGDSTLRRNIYRTYLDNSSRVNNWDLVDFTAHHIVGAHLFNRSRKPLYRLVKSSLLWDRRIALIATLYFIRQNDFNDTLQLTRILLNDREDLIHKAMGWMLREIGKRDMAVEEEFLKCHLERFPRTTLRYAIERFPEVKRQSYLKGTINLP